jgi:hypothetical protein
VPKRSRKSLENWNGRARFVAAALLCVSAILAVSGCGSSNEKFSSAESDRALAALDAIQEFVDEGRCTSAQRRVRVLATQSTHVNNDRPDLGEAYASSVARLQELVARECVEIKETTPTASTGETGPTTEEPTGTTDTPPEPEPTPDPEPTNGGTPVDPNNGNDNGTDNGGDNTTPPDTGGAAPQ